MQADTLDALLMYINLYTLILLCIHFAALCETHSNNPLTNSVQVHGVSEMHKVVYKLK